MGAELRTNERQKAETRQRILETGFRVFSEQMIDSVNLTDIAKAAGVGQATVYRYFNTKSELVLAVSTWVWRRMITVETISFNRANTTAAEDMERFLDSFIWLYREHRPLLRFNQFFNLYVDREDIPAEVMKPYMDVIDALEERFSTIYCKAFQDGTLRTDIPEKTMFSSALHLMLAAVTRYASGLVYHGGNDEERELEFLKEMLLRSFTTEASDRKPGQALSIN